jgi:hypothetical protein
MTPGMTPPPTPGSGVAAGRRKRAAQRARLRRLGTGRDEDWPPYPGWPGDGLAPVPDGSCPCPICRLGTSS